MKAARAAKATLPRRALSQLVTAGETGALHVEGAPGGVIYLTEGQVSYAESASAPDVGDLLTTSGRLSARTWESAVSSGKDGHRVGRLLVDQGHLTEGELELCVLGVIYDAAYFVLQPAAVPVRFAAGEQHWLGPVCRVDADVLSRETTRRRRLLDEVYESSTLDTAPVRPAPRPPVERVVLSSLQYELLISADGERTPATLARLLGRAGFVTLQQVRTLAAAGLIMTTPDERTPKTGDPGAPAKSVATVDAPTVKIPTIRADEAVRADEPAKPGRRATGRRRAGGRAGAAIAAESLPKRSPGEQMPAGAGDAQAAPEGGPLRDDAPDEALLTRIRSALKALR